MREMTHKYLGHTISVQAMPEAGSDLQDGPNRFSFVAIVKHPSTGTTAFVAADPGQDVYESDTAAVTAGLIKAKAHIDGQK